MLGTAFMALAATLAGQAYVHVDIHDVAAREIIRLMPEKRYDWQLRWSVFETRAHGVTWRLSLPGADAEAETQGVQRAGWLDETWLPPQFVACGSWEAVEAVAIRVQAELWATEADPVAEALISAGAEARPLNAPAGTPEPPEQYLGAGQLETPYATVWRLSVDGRSEAEMTASRVCTPLESAAAPNCWTIYRVEFEPDRPDRADSFGARCTTPGEGY